jgi:hypothetical protein
MKRSAALIISVRRNYKGDAESKSKPARYRGMLTWNLDRTLSKATKSVGQKHKTSVMRNADYLKQLPFPKKMQHAKATCPLPRELHNQRRGKQIFQRVLQTKKSHRTAQETCGKQHKQDSIINRPMRGYNDDQSPHEHATTEHEPMLPAREEHTSRGSLLGGIGAFASHGRSISMF